ncbi:MAG TPA: ferritin [Bacteroidaceae bacterium]|nr:ferritin [Bacteroidaceae bacterium]
MALKKRVENKLNAQINAEAWSAYLYLSMSNYLAAEGLNGFATWMRVQYEEETFHLMHMIDYVNERGGRVLLQPIAEVPTVWDNLLHVFEDTLKHEEQVSELINECMDVAIEERDHATQSFLKFYVDEQVEEEATVSDLLNNIKMTGSNGNGVFFLDKECATRTFTAPIV